MTTGAPERAGHGDGYEDGYDDRPPGDDYGDDRGDDRRDEDRGRREPDGPPPAVPFILYLEGPEYEDALRRLTMWVHYLLLPVYGREITSTAPWCSRWWDHPEAVAQFYGLWMTWQDMTDPRAGMNGPASWHRDYLGPVLASLRDPMGPFAGCKPGGHRPKEIPPVDDIDPFGPPPEAGPLNDDERMGPA